MKYFLLTTSLLLFLTGCATNAQDVVVRDEVVVSNMNVANSNAASAGSEQADAAESPPTEQVVQEAEPDDTSDDTPDNATEQEAVPEVNQNTNTAPETNSAVTQDTATPPAQEEQTQAEEESESAQIQVSLEVVSPGKSQAYSAQVQKGDTVEALMQVLKNSGLAYSTKGYGGIGKYVTTVNGLKEDRKARFYWILYLNGSRATAGMSTQTLKKGDAIKWNYEKEF